MDENSYPRCEQCIQVAAAEMTGPAVVFCACATSEQVASGAWKMKDFILPAYSELASDRAVFGAASSCAPLFKNTVPFFLLGDHPVYQRSSRLRLARTVRRGSAAGRLLGLRVRIQPGAWMSVSCICCVLSGRGLCDGPITRPEESYRLCCVTVCDLENLKNEAG